VPEFDAIGKRIFDLLAEDGRLSNLEIARQVGVSEKTVRQRIRRLIERDGMRVVAIRPTQAAPSRLIMMVRTEQGQRFVVADRLASLPEVDEVHLTTGAYELIVLASFESDSHALEFYVRHVEQGPGIEQSTCTHVIETINPYASRASDHFEDFEKQASAVGSMTQLLDIACDVATASLGADRVFVATGESWLGEPELALSTSLVRWRGLSSRYVEEIVKRRSGSSTLPRLIQQNQHLFVADAQTDPVFEYIRDLILSEGYHSWLTVPVRDRDTRRGTLSLYWDTIISYREPIVRRAQELADILGSNLARFSTEPSLSASSASD
jgi:DNA-binding Lrp family transcriptional regulator